MKLPRDVNGNDLVNVLKRRDYYPVSQTGSHIRLNSYLSEEQNNFSHLSISNLLRSEDRNSGIFVNAG